jgi:hypothetical protein
MDKELRRDRDLVRALRAAIFLVAVIAAACAVTAERNGIRMAGNDPPAAGSSGIARPHPPLDRAPGEALQVPL